MEMGELKVQSVTLLTVNGEYATSQEFDDVGTPKYLII